MKFTVIYLAGLGASGIFFQAHPFLNQTFSHLHPLINSFQNRFLANLQFVRVFKSCKLPDTGEKDIEPSIKSLHRIFWKKSRSGKNDQKWSKMAQIHDFYTF